MTCARPGRLLITAVVLAGSAASVSVGTGAAAQTPSMAPVTFSRDIAPIVLDRCGTCHHPGGPAPFSLLTYTAVRARAAQIASVTKRRFMPPWKADPPSVEFVGQTRLTDGEIEMIERWVATGAPEGDPRDLPPPPRVTPGWQLGTPDLIVTFPASYRLPAEGTDVFRIFALPVPLARTRHVIGLEFRPGNPRVVHHANIRIDRTSSSRERDIRDPAPGYEGLLARSAAYPGGHFFGWTPGQRSTLVPPPLAWRLDPGTDLVIEMHMQPSGKPEAVQSTVGLYFAPDGARDTGMRPPVMLRLGDQGIDIPGGTRDVVITDSYILPVDVTVQAVQPHAHYRARQIKGFAMLPDGTRRWLISIGDWDFRWQHVYRLATPVMLPKGTAVAMEFTYDNSSANARNPDRPPRRVRWGQRSSDEMGDLWLQLLTPNAADAASLARDTRRKMAGEDVVGYETMLESSPNDVELHDDVALLYLELGDAGRAVVHFEASARLRPESAAAHFNLGTALTTAGRLDAAIAAYRRALQIRPDYSRAHNNLGSALWLQGSAADALGHFQEAVRFDPRNVEAHVSLATAYAAAGDFSRAIAAAERALRLAPPEPAAGEIRRLLDEYRRQR
jgi:Flp pilus assembly protein TadD